MVDKLNIQSEMSAFDRKQRDFYDSLSDEEKKKFAPYLMIRWGSSVQGSRELQEYYVLSTNARLNKHFFNISGTKHKKFHWLMTTSVSPGLGTHRHQWIPPAKKSGGAKRRALQQIYPGYKDDEIDIMMELVSQKEIDAYFKSAGEDNKR